MIDHRSIKQKQLGLGCSTFGGSKSKKTALRALHEAYDLGVFYYDIARSYGYGQAESIVGTFTKDKRDKVMLTSKIGIAPPKPFPLMSQVKDVVRFAKRLAPGISQALIQSYSSKHVSRPYVTPRLAIDTLETSLRELQTDYLDFFLLHDCPFENAVQEDIAAAMEKAKTKGMIRAWGATCERPEELGQYFKEDSPFQVVQFPYASSNSFVRKNEFPDIAKVIFSVMSQSAGQGNPSAAFFEQLYINHKVPGLINNLPEAWLYIASKELDQGVVLCSMTQGKHIKRNVDIINAPDISTTALLEMKRKILERSNKKASFLMKQFRTSPI